jgi:hypothetical protein
MINPLAVLPLVSYVVDEAYLILRIQAETPLIAKVLCKS